MRLYSSPKTLTEDFDMSLRSVQRRIGEMKKFPLYRSSIIVSGRMTRVRTKAFEHYMLYGEAMKAGMDVPPIEEDGDERDERNAAG